MTDMHAGQLKPLVKQSLQEGSTVSQAARAAVLSRLVYACSTPGSVQPAAAWTLYQFALQLEVKMDEAAEFALWDTQSGTMYCARKIASAIPVSQAPPQP